MNGDKTNQHMRSAEDWATDLEHPSCDYTGEEMHHPGFWTSDMANAANAEIIRAIQAAAIATERGHAATYRKALKKIAEAWVEVFGKKVPVEYVKSVRDIAEQALAAPTGEERK